MQRFFANPLLFSLLLLVSQALAAEDNILRMATTTSTENSGSAGGDPAGL